MSSTTSPVAPPIKSPGDTHESGSTHHASPSPSPSQASQKGKSGKGHYSRPSQELAAHERLVRADARLRRTIPRDPIDRLDDILGHSYHHEGPFDATLASRQIPGRAPVEATRVGNALAMAATPRANIDRALADHAPLDGTSAHASGTTVRGERFLYDEENLVSQAPPESERIHKAGRDDDDDDDDGLIARWDKDDDDDVKHVRYRTDAMEMQASSSSRGIVEYAAELDEEEEESPSRSTGKSSGLLSGLKKRMSVKR